MRKFIPVIAAGALLFGALGAYGASEAMASDVVLSVDGQQSTVRTLAPTVGQVLASKEINVGAHDTVVPSLASKVTGGSEISVRYGRPITVTIDGKQTTMWTTATTVEEALGLFGIDSGAKISTSRSTTISREGLSFDVNSPRNVTVTVDGATKPVTATGAVLDALNAAGVTLGTHDEVTPDLSTALTDNLAITIVRVEVRVSSAITAAAQPQVTLVGAKTATSTTTAPAKTTPAAGNSCGVSWYASGSRTANGEAFNPDGLTAASKTLPFNTQVKVTNPANGNSVIVRINDRGPYVTGRCLDLARGAFSQIASLGTGAITATWEVVG
jgi:rare lipoprotein A (peptidoglycan hydrolase)